MQGLDTLAERLADAAEQHDAVARLEGGGVVETATYLPGRRVMGVRDMESGIEVHVVLHWPSVDGRSIPAIVDDLRDSLRRLTSKPLTIVVRDLQQAPQDTARDITGGLS